MPTVSTKQRHNKERRTVSGQSSTGDASALEAEEVSRTRERAPESLQRWWWIACILVLLVAAIIRVYALELRPLHHDEGVNGFFLTRLFREGKYEYDPANYHGPTLYYFALPPAFAIGLNTIAIRLVPALFGLATVGLVLCLRRYIGSLGALTAGALLAVSPGAVYISRYFIHEALFVFFTLALVVAAVRFYDTSRSVYLMLAAASAALMFATKETAFISAGVLLLATALAWRVARLAREWEWKPVIPEGVNNDQLVSDVKNKPGTRQAMKNIGTLARFGGAQRLIILFIAAFALFILINILFYSSFFTYSKGVEGALKTFSIWTKTGSSDHTAPFHRYIKWLLQEESPLLILGTAGAALALLRIGVDRFALFAGAWAFGTLLAYSLIPYKTPWLALSFIVPLAIVGGYTVNVLYLWCLRREIAWRALPLVLAFAGIAVCVYQSVRLNFQHYDDDRYPYVYAHTRREFLQLVAEVERLAARAGTGRETRIALASPDYWPMPWYLREYKHVGFHGRVGNYSDAIIIANETQEAELEPLLGDKYQRVGTAYALRPGVNLVIYARRELAGL
ncbi:MAG: TIGR03663 family protein [Acidobacteriota bacterium]|nr:TIGR03663 family protein [Acidobacteriota bacterium]